MTDRLHAGIARAIITPPVGIAHAGWGVQTHSRAAGVDLDLFATVLVLQGSDTQAAILDLEFCIVGGELAASIRRAVAELTGIPISNVRLSYTHTHSGPMLGPSWLHDGAEMIPAYVDSLPDRIAGAAWEAQQHLQPVRVAASTGACSIGVNRRYKMADGRVVCGRNWDGFVDRTVEVVRFDDLDERIVATIVHFAAHPTVMGPPNQLITPDYPGVVRRTVGAATGAPSLFLQGAAGNIHAVVDYVADTRIYHRLGSILGHEASKLALQTRTLPRKERLVEVLESGAPLGIYADDPDEEPDGTLRVLSKVVPLAIRPYQSLADLTADYEGKLAELEGIRARAEAGPELTRAIGAAKRAHMELEAGQRYAGRRDLDVELHAIRIGQIALVGFPGEPFSELGVAIRARSPFAHTLFSGYTSDYFGYLPTDDARPDGGYEVDTTPFAAGSADAVVSASLGMLEQMRS
jgi:hypothetical protein